MSPCFSDVPLFVGGKGVRQPQSVSVCGSGRSGSQGDVETEGHVEDKLSGGLHSAVSLAEIEGSGLSSSQELTPGSSTLSHPIPNEAGLQE